MQNSITPVRRLGLFCLLIPFALAACAPEAPPAGDALQQVLAADDQRGTPVALEILRAGLASTQPTVRAAAVRALGRLERIDFAAEIAAVARQDSNGEVRVAATHALAQAAFTGDGSDVMTLLGAVLANDPNPAVRAAAAISAGRLRFDDPSHTLTTEVVLRVLMAGPADPAVAAAAARGMAALVRTHPDHALEPDTVDALARIAGAGPDELDAGSLGQVAATAALLGAGALRDETLSYVLSSGNPEVRRLAVSALGRSADPVDASALAGALDDVSGRVRLEAVRALRSQDATLRCNRLDEALDDPWLPVRLTAIDELADRAGATETLAAITDGSWAAESWHPAAHALISLARLAPDQAAPRIGDAAGAEPWQARMYSARAAGEVGDLDVLRSLTADPVANVQHAALRGLQTHSGHAADDAYAAALSSADYQVVIIAANGLVDSPGDHLPAVFDALDRITAEQRETSRDPRAALLRAAASLGDEADAPRLEAYLVDYDAAIAAQSAEIVTTWTGDPAAASPQPLAPLPFPNMAELEEIAATRAILHMDSGDSIELEFFPFDAPTHAARFVRRASEGYFDGLTLHRVVFNFVLQGGSPGANEYMGDGAYTRDEITARAHARGTVGTSTRGRDTGDGQLFINLVDNLRLDFDYTIFAAVTGDESVIDNLLEGAVIESITLNRRE